MKTIAVITDEFLPVTQTFIYQEITSIKAFNILVLTTRKQNGSLFPFKNLYVCKNSTKVTQRFSTMIKKQKAELIHVKFGTVALRYLKLKKLTRLPFIVSFHGYDASEKLKNPMILSEYKKKLFPAVDHIITVSQKLKDNLVKAGCPKNKITVLWSGVDTVKFYYKPRIHKNNETIKILCVARLTEKKGIHYLIKSFSRVVKVRPNTELLIIGQGNLKQSLKQQISKLNLDQKVKIMSYVAHDQIANIMHKHHIFCLPSITSSKGNEEGIPNVLKEACATGMPVVSTYHSGIPHLIKNGKNGFLVTEKNTTQLTEKLIDLIDHPDIWENMGLWGRKYVEEHFDKHTQAKKLEQLYTDLISSKKR